MMMLIESPGGERCLVASLDGYDGWQVIGDGLPLDIRRTKLIEQLKRLRDQSEFGPLTTPQGVLQIDQQSRTRISEKPEQGRTFERLTGEAYSTSWWMLSNEPVTVTLPILDDWTLLIGARGDRVQARYRSLRTSIESADHQLLDALEDLIAGAVDLGSPEQA